MISDGYVTWEILASYAGASAMTSLIVQFLKGFLDKYFKMPTQLLSYIVAVAVLTLAVTFTSGFSFNKLFLILFNAIVVSTSSNGIYDGIRRTTKRKVML